MATHAPHIDVGATLGAFEIGVIVSVFLFGLVTVQTFTYYNRFPEDTWYLKAFVGILWGLELFHTITCCSSLYEISIIRYGQPEFIFKFPATLIIAIVLSAIIGPSVQAFFANRIRVLSNGWLMPCTVWLLSLLRAISLIAVAGVASGSDVFIFKKKSLWLLVTSLSISTANDILIAASLCYYLLHRRDNSITRTKNVVDKLILWTIQTGLLTSLATTTLLIVFVARNDYAWVAIFFTVCRLFSNSLMASLNGRATLRGLNQKADFVGDSGFRFRQTPPKNVNIAMTSVTEQWDRDAELQKSTALESEGTKVSSSYSFSK